jgi:hypothetical protein
LIFFFSLSSVVKFSICKKNKFERQESSKMVLAIIVRVSPVAYESRHKNKKTSEKKERKS